MTGKALKGEFGGKIAGNITGELSSDGSQMKGRYDITMPTTDNGSWQAQKK
ncbi:hypothetical protein D1AOALGA4SA_7238 [Olavius algarvensis Delta 1 endosymbiont]|nr:hypothetical protein D1AOALGA4SA_7238 [Olavius algarvensis Delta 1 endosymbiont]